MTSQERLAVIKDCKERSIAGTIPFPEVVRRLHAAGVERYHVDLTRDETTYYLSCGESHVLATGVLRDPIAESFDVAAVEGAVRASQRGEIIFPEFLRRIMAAGCVGYFTQITGSRVQYVGRTGDLHVEPFLPAKT
ncbi:hypothetical protein VT84_16550 [Gemmata sp. SH-PL17]|uniref:DUF1398 domain-containing protein n=1 Tax=Gemmata sp. SH-PL17 TaxID=1630693 RepID=UPI0006964211|nr:hypothetical protein [Gemmata sp. SH-PL17]AMV26011.1 hypothetical protein VT84_16550 [Gemmata sp. SH-PL17]